MLETLYLHTLSPANSYWRKLSDVSRACIFIVLSGLLLAIMNACIRHVNDAYPLHTLEIVFFRNLLAIPFLFPLIGPAWKSVLKTERLKLHFIRSLIGLGGMYCFFFSITLLPLAKAIALNFSMPLFVLVGAALILREPVGPRRIGATLIGFLGVLLILQPGFSVLSWQDFLPVLAAVFMACAVLTIKVLSHTERVETVLIYMGIFMTPISLVPALFVWHWPSMGAWVWLWLIGFLATVAHFCMNRGFKLADTTLLMPFDYLRLPFTAFIAFVWFGQIPTVWVWIGALVISASAIYISYRETQLAKR